MDQPTQTVDIQKPYREMNPEELSQAVEANKKIFDEHFNPEYLRHLNAEILDFMNLYYRPVFVGFDEMASRREREYPLIYACNHSGMAFPWDAMIFGSSLFEKHNYDLDKLFRVLVAPSLSASDLMNPFLIPNLWKMAGAVDAYGLNFETMMHYKDANLLIYPEGVPGIGKGFNRKYEMQTFSTSMIRMAIKFKTEIVGISCVNGEYVNPYSYSIKPIDRFVQKLGIPFLPIALQTPLLLIFPWLFYYGMPAKLTYIKGKTYKPYEMADGKSLEELSIEEVKSIRDKIQADMQVELDKAVTQYGDKPYNWKEFRRNLRTNFKDLPFWTPIGWPALFTEFDRRYKKEGKPPKNVTKGFLSFWRIVIRNPFVLSYYIPILGWIPLVIKGLSGREKVKEWTPDS
ncbi:MAG: hypothetical protein AAFY71_18530 [Bacteroidota bacterium]